MTKDSTTKCEWCGNHHPGQKCQLVRALEYYDNGALKRVEFLTPADCQVPVTLTPGFSGTVTPQWPLASTWTGQRSNG